MGKRADHRILFGKHGVGSRDVLLHPVIGQLLVGVEVYSYTLAIHHQQERTIYGGQSSISGTGDLGR